MKPKSQPARLLRACRVSAALSSLRAEKGSRGSRRTTASGGAVGVLPTEGWPVRRVVRQAVVLQ